MEQFSRANPSAMRDEKTSSVYSTGSASTRTTGYRKSSADSSSSRPTSYTPSYMNAVPARKPAPPRTPLNGHSNNHSNGSTATQPIDIAASPQTPDRRTPSVNVKKGSLFLFIADAIHPSTLIYLETMLRRGAYSNIAVIGRQAQEKELKALKIQVYALLGKLSHSSVGVEVKMRETWDEKGIVDILNEAMKANGSGEPVNGVLCSPVYGGEEKAGMMDMSEEQLGVPWKNSVGFLHGVAKAAFPNMRTAAGLFAVTGPTQHSPISTFYKTACESLIDLLAEDTATSGAAIVHAENVLVPEPEPEPRPISHDDNGQQQRIKSMNGIQIPPQQPGPVHDQYDPPDFAPSESPTKLWNMWALHEQLGAD